MAMPGRPVMKPYDPLVARGHASDALFQLMGNNP